MRTSYIFYFLLTFINCINSRIVIIADVHGDIHRFKNILQDAHIIDKHNNWIAIENTTIVQLGDQIDPKYPIENTYHYEMIHYTYKLEKKAKKKNSKFISLIGNHELMNLEKIKYDKYLKKIIASRPIIEIIDEYMFCHGMFNNFHLDIINKYNKTLFDINKIWYNYVNNINETNNEILEKLITSSSSILYNRIPDDKFIINKLFEKLNINYLFVGHTINNYIRVKDNIWYLDLLIKNAFDNNSYNYIIINEGVIFIKHFTL